MCKDNAFMTEALELAKIAAQNGEIPVGAVIVRENQIIATGYNQRENKHNALSHAEIEAINNACKTLKKWRLNDCDMYVTLEPCPMCAGAILSARINKLIYAVSDYKSGACGSVINLFDMPFNHRPKIVTHVLEKECTEELTNFFQNIRQK